MEEKRSEMTAEDYVKEIAPLLLAAENDSVKIQKVKAELILALDIAFLELGNQRHSYSVVDDISIARELNKKWNAISELLESEYELTTIPKDGYIQHLLTKYSDAPAGVIRIADSKDFGKENRDEGRQVWRNDGPAAS